MKDWLYVLVSPRPTFQIDMTDDEKVLMREHAQYWRGHLESGKALLFGPVIHPRAEFGGMAVLSLDDDEDPMDYSASDPVNRADVGFRFESYLMPQLARADR